MSTGPGRRRLDRPEAGAAQRHGRATRTTQTAYTIDGLLWGSGLSGTVAPAGGQGRSGGGRDGPRTTTVQDSPTRCRPWNVIVESRAGVRPSGAGPRWTPCRHKTISTVRAGGSGLGLGVGRGCRALVVLTSSSADDIARAPGRRLDDGADATTTTAAPTSTTAASAPCTQVRHRDRHDRGAQGPRWRARVSRGYACALVTDPDPARARPAAAASRPPSCSRPNGSTWVRGRQEHRGPRRHGPDPHERLRAPAESSSSGSSRRARPADQSRVTTRAGRRPDPGRQPKRRRLTVDSEHQ